MKSGLQWHPRHPDRQRPSRREEIVVQYADPAPPTYVEQITEPELRREHAEREFADEAARAADAFGIPRGVRLPLPRRSSQRLDPAATARVSRRLQQERLEAEELRRVGLLPEEGTG